MKKEKNTGKKKKKSAKGVAAVAVLALAAWLLSHFPGLSLGIGNGSGNGEVNATAENSTGESASDTQQTEEIKSTEETETTEEASETELILIVVKGSEITVNGAAAADEKAVKDAVMSLYEEGIEIRLSDDQAVKASYDLVKKVLDELDYNYTETK